MTQQIPTAHPLGSHQVYAVIPFNRNGAILGILRIAFKAFFEYVREETFGKFGLQQIQAEPRVRTAASLCSDLSVKKVGKKFSR